MKDTAQKLIATPRGILAADESTKTITKRFESIGLTSSPELNRKYREMLFTTPNIEEYVGGVIMYDETVRQKTSDGIPFIEYLSGKGIVPGIKVDGGLEPFGEGEEEITKFPEDLEVKLKEYADMGLKFSKWRGVVKISDIYPTDIFLNENFERMAKYAKFSQEANLVPIVEPEVLLDGSHTTTRCEEIETKALKILFEKLVDEGVDLSALILKTSMVLPGKDSGVKAAPQEVAQVTIRTLKNSVPTEVPGIVFLSGGQNPNEATINLNEIEMIAKAVPWQISFSFARALQEEALNLWKGKDENVKLAQEAFLNRAKLVSEARKGMLEK